MFTFCNHIHTVYFTPEAVAAVLDALTTILSSSGAVRFEEVHFTDNHTDDTVKPSPRSFLQAVA